MTADNRNDRLATAETAIMAALAAQGYDFPEAFKAIDDLIRAAAGAGVDITLAIRHSDGTANETSLRSMFSRRVPKPPPARLKTLHEFISAMEALSPQIASLSLKTKINDRAINQERDLYNLANSPDQLERFAKGVDDLVSTSRTTPVVAERSLIDMLSGRASQFYGNYCELACYIWLMRNMAEFQTQVALQPSDVLGNTPRDLDGRFTDVDVVFDIKAAGMQQYLRDEFVSKLESRFPSHDVTVDGPMDCKVKDIESFAFRMLSTHVAALTAALSGNASAHTVISQLGWSISVRPKSGIRSEIHTVDPYQFAEQNAYYPFKTCRQFRTVGPFVLVFGYSNTMNRALAVNFTGMADIALRSLARRAFLQSGSDLSPASAHDAVPESVTMKDASELLSGILFVNLDKDDEGYIFANPRAKFPLDRRAFEAIFDFRLPVTYDGFEHDCY